MPLLINGKVMGKPPRTVGEFIQSYPHFKELADNLCAQAKRTVGPAKLLYVGQREMAATSPRDGSKATCLAHLDGSGTEEAIKDMVSVVKRLSLEHSSDRLELSLVGGFADDRLSSEELSVRILALFHCQPEEIHLTMACITDLNTVKKNGIYWPVIYGIGVDVTTGEIYPATFPNKGPDHPIRSARHFCGGDKVLNIYDHENHHLTIGPFHYDTMDNVDRWCQAPDSFLRKYLSTSPEQEPEDFEASVRQTLIQIRDFPNPLKTVFKNGKPRAYKKEEDGSWTML